MFKQQRGGNGPRCAGCNRVFQPRQLRDGSWSQTCGQTACVAVFNRKKDANMSHRSNKPKPQTAW